MAHNYLDGSADFTSSAAAFALTMSRQAKITLAPENNVFLLIVRFNTFLIQIIPNVKNNIS